MLRLVLPFFLCLSACDSFPEVDAAFDAADGAGTPPALLSFDALLTSDTPRLTPTSDAGLQARARGLRARADALRAPVIDARTKARMAAGINGL